MTVELARRLLWGQMATQDDIANPLSAFVDHHTPFLIGLLQRRPDLSDEVDRELARAGGETVVDVDIDDKTVEELPQGMCEALLAVPLKSLGRRAREVRVAVADPLGAHLAAEFRHHLGREVRVVRAPLEVLVQAMGRAGLRPNRATSPAPKPAAREPSEGPRDTIPPSMGDEPIPLVRRAPRESEEPAFDLTSMKAQPSAGVQPPTQEETIEEPPVSVFSASQRATQKALDSLEVAESPDGVVNALLFGMDSVATHIGVFAVRAGTLKLRARVDPSGVPSPVEELSVSLDERGVLSEAVKNGHYFGLPFQRSDKEVIRRIVGNHAPEVSAMAIGVSGRPALVLVCSGFDNPFTATRQAEKLAAAASEALERIVRSRKV